METKCDRFWNLNAGPSVCANPFRIKGDSYVGTIHLLLDGDQCSTEELIPLFLVKQEAVDFNITSVVNMERSWKLELAFNVPNRTSKSIPPSKLIVCQFNIAGNIAPRLLV